MNYSYENLIKGVTESWIPMFDEIFNNEKGKKLFDFLNKQEYTIFPKPEQVFNAFKYFGKDDANLVLLGQDPYFNSEYHDNMEVSQAMGLSFSVPKQFKRIPPSLKNIYKEIKNEFPNFEIPNHGDLTDLVKNNNMLLLNSALTVKKGKSNSHQRRWVNFTDKILEYISNNCDNVVFILLGNYAKKKDKFIDENKHSIVRGVHPSPLSARYGFFNSDIFKKVNNELKKMGKNELNLKLS